MLLKIPSPGDASSPHFFKDLSLYSVFDQSEPPRRYTCNHPFSMTVYWKFIPLDKFLDIHHLRTCCCTDIALEEISVSSDDYKFSANKLNFMPNYFLRIRKFTAEIKCSRMNGKVVSEPYQIVLSPASSQNTLLVLISKFFFCVRGTLYILQIR